MSTIADETTTSRAVAVSRDRRCRQERTSVGLVPVADDIRLDDIRSFRSPTRQRPRRDDRAIVFCPVAASSVDPQTRSNEGRSRQRREGRRRLLLVLAGIAAISLMGPLLVLGQSPNGVHASPDSFTYLSAATTLAKGDGWTYAFGEAGSPVTLFPPLYPLVLAVPEMLDISLFAWALWQNAILLGVLSFVVGITVMDATDGSPVPAIGAAALVQLGTPITIVYAHIWSETLFYPTVVVALASVARFLAGGRIRWLLIAAGATSVGMLTRYAGLSAFATVCLLLVGWPGRSALERVRRVTIFAAIALPLNALWLIRNHTASGTLTGNNQLVHELSGDEVLDGFRTIGRWFIPDQPDDVLRLVLPLLIVSFALLVAALLPASLRSERTGTARLHPVVVVCLAYAVVHFLFIVVTNAFSTRSPPFNDRILGSTFAPMVIVLVVLGHAMWKAFPRSRTLQVSTLLLGASLLVLSVGAATHTMPLQYTSEPGTLTYYRGISRSFGGVIDLDVALLSNRANIAWFLTGRPVASLPRSCSGGQVLPNPTYEQELRDLAESLSDAPRQVIFFRRSPRCEPFSMKGLKMALRLEDASPRGPIFVLEGPSVNRR
jgi:hypothetical protein